MNDSTYIGRIRKLVGHQLVMSPGAQVLPVRITGTVFLQRRADSGMWEIPAGGCEPGDSFRDTAVRELAEEAGIQVDPSRLVPFATISDPAVHTLQYPNGDLVHAFALCFFVMLRADDEEREPTDGEALDGQWFRVDRLPAPVHPPTALALTLYREYLQSGLFQAE